LTVNLARTGLPALLVLLSWLQPGRADEQQTFYGKTVDAWIAVLRDKTGTDARRQQAVWALGCFGPDAKAAVPNLVDATREKQLSDAAISALARIRSSDDVIVPILIEEFVNEGCQHLTGAGTFVGFGSAAGALARIGGPAVPALINVLNGPNWDMRVCAAEALSKIGPPAVAAVPSLIRAIEHPDPQHDAETLSLRAVRALGRIGPEAKAAVPILNRMLEKKNGNDFDVVKALDGIGAPPVRTLIDAVLRDGDPYVADQLAWLGSKAREAAPALRIAQTDKRPQFRFSAAKALAFIDPPAADAIPVLIEGLNYLDNQEISVDGVPSGLAHLGPEAKAALPALIALVTKRCEDTDVIRALPQIDPEGRECVPALISALEHDDRDTADVAAKCLGLLGPRAKAAVQALADIVTRDFDEDEGITVANPQVSAAKALQRIGMPALSALPKLVLALKSDYSAAEAAATVLGSFGSQAKPAIPYLIEAVKTKEKDNENWLVRQAAILALGRIGADAKVAIPILHDVVKELGKGLQSSPEVLIALYQLDPAGQELAESWLRSQDVPHHQSMEFRLKARTILLGAMGRTSVESDWLTRRYLERMDSNFGSVDPRDDDNFDYLEEWLETLGHFGIAGRMAIPRMNDLRKHPNPWVRMWAAETLERITAPPRAAKPAKPAS
jgi:HEAT repeat protein